MVKVINYLKINPRAKEKSFRLKNRIRRQYDSDDINIAKLFLAIREHKIGNPELDKTSAIKELLTQVKNINDIDLNDGGNTLLHVAVRKKHQDIVELLLNVPDIDPNIKNDQGDTSLHIAASEGNEELVRLLLSKKAEINIENKDGKTPLDIARSNTQPNKEKIIETLEEHLKKSSGQVKRLSAQEREVHEKLRKFVENFVFIYERSLSEYYERLESQKGKPGKWAGFANKVMYIGRSGTEGTEDTKIKAFSLIGINVLQLAISGIGNHHNREELKKLMDQLYIFKTNPIKVREELVKSGVEIFQIFESQFVQVKADGSWQRAMTKLAEDAVSRVVDYYREHTEEEFCASSITEGIIFGKSKKYKQTFTNFPRIKPGHTLESKNSWNTAELFDKAGLVTIKSDGSADKYYRKRDGKSDTSKYGYRLLFKWELENKIKKFVREYSEEKPPKEEYRYVLKSDEGKWEGELLDEINKQDSKLVEERLLSNFKEEMEQEAEKNFNELESFIDKNFNELSSYIESNQSEIKEVFDDTIKQVNQKIADSIVEGRKESKESFGRIHQKLDKVYDAVVAKQQVREPVWFGVKKPVSLFTGRKEELIDLHNKVQCSSGKVTVISQITSISGLGGIGKTELAREYIQEYSKDYYKNVIWINAESEVSLIESFTRLARDKLKIDKKDANEKEKDIQAIVEEVYEFFSNSKSLFIFDDAEKSDYLNKFLPIHDLLPGGNGPYILITSRNREWGKGIEVINLNELKSEEAIKFVKKGLSIQDESQNEKIKVLVEKLQHFPLAIQQAIAYIEDQRVTGEFDIDDYLNEYEKKTKDLLNYKAFKGIDNDYAKTTFTTWKITTDKIASDRENGKLALRILNVISYLAPDKIRREAFLGLTGNSEEELRSAVRLLIKYSMVNGEQKQSVLSTHKLVQEVTRIALVEEGKSEEVMEETFKLLEASFPYGGDKLEDYLKKRELLPHLEVFLSHIDNWLKKNPEDKQKIEEGYLKRLLILINDGYFNLSNPQRQKELLERALPILEKYYGKDHFEVAQILVNLSIPYGILGDYQKQKELIERALLILENHYGIGNFEVAKILVDLSSTYGALDDYEGAKDLLEGALPVLEGYYGEDHFQVAKTLVNLSITYRALGDYQKQKELLERALLILDSHYGEDHFLVAMALVNLSTCYENSGNYERAKDLLERALPVLRKHYGEDHFLVAMALVNLSTCYENSGNYERAKDLLERALPILEEHYDSRHFIVEDISQDLLQISLYIDAKEGNFNLVKNLIEEGADIFGKSYNDIILYQAISSNNKEVIRLILEKIKEKDPQNFYKYINARDKEGGTPLMWATQNGETNAAKMLLKYGADPNIRDNNGKTPLDLAQEKLAKDPENDNFKVMTALLLSVKDEFQYQEEQIAISLEECLPSISSGRVRREAKMGKCKLSWEDIDEFNIEKDEKREFSKIKIDSERFLNYIQDLPKDERFQLIELADKVEVTGSFRNLINKLTSNQKVMNHLNRVKKISSITMHGMMAKNILADFLNRDYQGVAINVGLIAGGQGFAKVAEVASRKGLNLLVEGKALLGRSLRVASPFLARGTSVFIAYDLVSQVKAFRNGTEGALVGIIGDSIYLGVDSAEIGIEVAEGFEVLEGVSSVTGPIGAGIGAVVFVGTDVYMTVKKVKKIDQIIHLTGREKFIEGLRAFIGMQPEQYIEKLMEEKQLYNQLVKQGFEYLKQHSDIQSYVFPTANNKFKPDLDNKILLDKKRTDIKWSRARPNDPSGGKLFCLPQGNDEPAPSYGSYLCENAIGLSANKTGDHTLINLGEGEDYAKGFLNSSNIFIVNSGYKEYYGGNKNDIFVLQGDLIEGFLYGEDGIDTLDLTEFAQEAVNVNVYLNGNTGTIVYKHHEYHAFKIDSVEKVLGRKAKSERIFSTCYTKFLDGQGGTKNDSDIITINNNDCTHKTQIIVRSNTVVYNQALEGSFDYLVPLNGSGSAELSFIYEPERYNVNNTFWFAYEPADIKSIDVKYINVFNRTKHEVKFNFIESDKEFNVTIFYSENPSYRLENNGEIRIGNKDNLYMLQSSNESAEEIIKNYLPIANRLNKMSFFIQSLLSNETVVIGSGNHEVIHNNPAYKSHLVGNGGENVYVIDSEIDNVPEVVIHDIDEENSIDTIDLRSVVKKAKDNFELQVIKFENDLLLRATVEKQKDEYFTVRLKDGVERYNKTHVRVENAPMIINFDNNQWSLKPQPLMFEKNKEIIVITSQDVEKGTELVTPRKGGNYTFVRSNSNDLMITNAFDSTITKDDLCSITLSKFYKIPKMKTLSIKFADKEIVLKDYDQEISTARDVDVVRKEYEDQVYGDVFNHSPEPHRRRHEHSRHKQNNRHRRSTNSSARPSSWINDLFGWVKSSIGGFRAALSGEASNTASLIPQVDAQIDVNGTIMLLDVFVRKVTGQKRVSSVENSISLLEAQGYALNIIEEFEEVIKQAALKSGISMHRLNIDFVEVQKDITRKIVSGEFNEISGFLNSYVEQACHDREAGKLSLKKFNKFMTTFNNKLNITLDQLIPQMLHNENNVPKADNIKEPQNLGLSPRTKLDEILVAGNVRELVAGRK